MLLDKLEQRNQQQHMVWWVCCFIRSTSYNEFQFHPKISDKFPLMFTTHLHWIIVTSIYRHFYGFIRIHNSFSFLILSLSISLPYLGIFFVPVEISFQSGCFLILTDDDNKKKSVDLIPVTSDVWSGSRMSSTQGMN
jgi:hypothetical protein